MKPVAKKIQIKIDDITAGALDLSGRPTAIESGEILAIGSDVQHFKIGQTIVFKSWALDVITYQDKQYYFIDEDSKGICAII